MSENKKKSWKKLKNIVEFFWPYYDPLTEKQIIDRKNREEEFSRKNVETKLEDVKDKIKIDFMLEQAEKVRNQNAGQKKGHEKDGIGQIGSFVF
jgi:hypothetical protein